MGAGGAKPAYATPYGAYGPRVGQIPNPATRPGYQQQGAYAPQGYAPQQAFAQQGYAPQQSFAPQSYGQPAFAPTYSQPGFSQYGRPAAVGASSQSQAYALDAADGVIDGRFFGQQVAVTRPTYAPSPAAYAAPAPMTYAAPTYAAPMSYAAPTYTQYAAPVTSYAAPVTSYAAAPTYSYGGYGGGAIATTSQQNAFALDAADGVIDGRFFGSQVGVTAPSAYGYGAPATYGAGTPFGYGF